MNKHEEPIHPSTEGNPHLFGDSRGEYQRLPQTMDELEFLVPCRRYGYGND